ncbi:acetyl-CoA carboxylase alpha subunit [Gloeomargarita lithophora Alchichica-D10]|uniref:Acetyl-coenzyme A carboxylase carboxyl transferase subunit alpha n=1 Tax=Gloeomargarita lithophora Alchichica-D10 TaxID=1188229 RepID=A0A1J0ABX2_9CYAN|nr:acetyl-CoA carboxylase carboxyltransferase subunit alpha [Gloeomargarita lithophora]APB33421.1 acetyl-CoA carboxylase alpha subunit [Gloeomargarita lithophora Alchichica-D10]
MTPERKAVILDFERPLVEMEQRIHQIEQMAQESGVDVSDRVQQLVGNYRQLRQEIFSRLSPEQRVKVARHPRRPTTLDYIQAMTDEWLELHGDRGGSDDPALVGGLARLGGQAVLIVGHQKGRDTKENVARNFGMASPGGYRKALRLMHHAHRFGLPLIALIDTPGAYPGVEAERLGQGEAIAVNLQEMFTLEVPVICVVIGEGGSGGALGIGVGDRILMFEHAIYSVISPEGCAAILWKDSTQAAKAAQALKLTAPDLLELGLIDQILPEPLGAAHADPVQATETLKRALLDNLARLRELDGATLCRQRYDKFRRMGVVLDG